MKATTKTASRKKKHAAEVVVPDKLYFRIGEVAQLCGVATYVLRFWETEFPQLKPAKSDTGQRTYRRREVELALRIKQLLYEEGFTIPGARAQLKTEAKPAKAQPALPFPRSAPPQDWKRVRQGLQEILALLSSPLAKRAKASN